MNRTEQGPAIAERLIDLYGEHPDEVGQGDFVNSLGNIAAAYMPDIQFSISGSDNLPVGEHVAEPDRANTKWFLEALGKDPEAYGTVLHAQEAYTAVALDYVINDVDDGNMALRVENVSQAGGEVAGILSEARATAVFDSAIAEDEEFNNNLETGSKWAQRIVGAGIGLFSENVPVAGTIAGWAAEDLIAEMEEGLQQDRSGEAARDAHEVHTQGEVRAEDAADAAATAAASKNGNLGQQTIIDIGEAARRGARTGHGDGVRFSSE
jgi:hypothetical protein